MQKTAYPVLPQWDSGKIDQHVWENRKVGLMRWNTSCCTRELCSSQGNRVLCSPELMSENWAGRSCAVLRGLRLEEHAALIGPGRSEWWLLLPAAALLVACCIRLAGVSLWAEYPNQVIIIHFSLLVFNLDSARWCLLVPTVAILIRGAEKRCRQETVKLPHMVSTQSHVLFLSFLIVRIPWFWCLWGLSAEGASVPLALVFLYRYLLLVWSVCLEVGCP